MRVRSQHLPGPSVSISCPVCKATPVPAQSYQQVDRMMALRFIPLFSWKTTYVKCSACKKKLNTKLHIEDLRRCTLEEVSPTLKLAGYTGIAGVTLLILTLLLCWLPVVGLLFGIAAVLGNRNKGLARTLSWIGASLGLISTVLVYVLAKLGYPTW